MIEGLIGAVAGASFTVAVLMAVFSVPRRHERERAARAVDRAKVQAARAEKHLACAIQWEDLYRAEVERSQRLLATADALRLALKRWTADQDCRVEGGTFSRN